MIGLTVSSTKPWCDFVNSANPLVYPNMHERGVQGVSHPPNDNQSRCVWCIRGSWNLQQSRICYYVQ